MSRMLPRFRARPGQYPAVSILTAAVFSFAGLAEAEAFDWTVDPQKSEIAFETGSGTTTKGVFRNYRTEIEFDPEMPEETAVHVVFDMKSASTGKQEADQTLQSADFFDTGHFPAAEFAARGAKPDGDGKYILEGRLTLKGVAKPVTLPFTIDIKDGTATVRAETTINRLDFGVGPATVAGSAGDTDVKLTIDLTAVRLDN